MLGESEGCISKILRRNRETGQPHQRKRGGSMKMSTPQEDRQLLWMVRMNRFISAPCLQMICWFGRRMSVQTIRRRLLAAGYWSRCPARSPRLTLELRRRRHEWGGGTECGTSDNGDTASSVMSPGSPYTTVTGGSGCTVGKGRGWMMPASSLMMEVVTRQSWYGVQSTMGGGVSWPWWMEPWTGICTSRSWGIKCCYGRRGCFDISLCPRQCPAPYSTWHGSLFGPTGCWAHGLASSESRHEPNWACLGSNVSLDPRHGWPPFHCRWTKQCCPPGMGCSSARKGADPGREHASSYQGSSGH